MKYSSNLNVNQEKPQHAVDAGEDPNAADDPLGPRHRAHRLRPHWMADGDVPADGDGGSQHEVELGVAVGLFHVNDDDLELIRMQTWQKVQSSDQLFT